MSRKFVSGWQAIADFLHVSVRTVQRWEKEKSLPIHRTGTASGDDGKRSSVVYAFPDELTRWIETEGGREHLGQANDSAARVTGSLKSHAKVGLLTAFAGFAVILGAVYLVSNLRDNDPFALMRIEPNRIVVLNRDGEGIWGDTFEGVIKDSRRFEADFIGDFDGDGRNDVLFLFNPLNEGQVNRDRLILYEPDGTVRWEYTPGQIVNWGEKTFTGTYSVRGLVVGKHADGGKFIVLIANNLPSFPGQVSVLGGDGNLLSEYWNTGYVFDCKVMDLDGDGTDEILLAGINNRSPIDHRDGRPGVPFFAVIEPGIGKAISPVPEGYAPGYAAGREQAYIIFPRTDVANAIPADSRIERINLVQPDLIMLNVEIERDGEIQERVYCLDRELNVVSLDFPASFGRLHTELEREGLLDHPFDLEFERKALMTYTVLSSPQ